MSTEQVREVTVRLEDAQDLFAEPDPGSDRSVSGMEELYRAVKVQTRVLLQRPHPYRVTIELPSEKITDGLAEDLSARMKRYCQFQAEQSRQDLQVLRHQGVDSLWMGSFVLLPGLVLGVLCTWLSQSGINGLLQAVFFVLAMVFILSAGWVALWMPAEFFLYDTWPFQLDMRVYQQLADADMVISERYEEAAPEEGTAPRSVSVGAPA
jgi:hypothetical protein